MEYQIGGVLMRCFALFCFTFGFALSFVYGFACGVVFDLLSALLSALLCFASFAFCFLLLGCNALYSLVTFVLLLDIDLHSIFFNQSPQCVHPLRTVVARSDSSCS